MVIAGKLCELPTPKGCGLPDSSAELAPSLDEVVA